MIYERMKRATELRIKRTPRIIVPFWRTFSGPLLVIGPIHPDIEVRLSETFLFCISTIAMSKIEMIISVNWRAWNIVISLKI